MKYDIEKDKYVYLGQYKSPLLYHWLLQNWADDKVAAQYGLPKLNGQLLLLDGHIFACKKDWEQIKQWTYKAVEQQDKKAFNAIFRFMAEMTSKMLVTAKKLEKSKGLRNNLFDEYFKALNQMQYPWFFVLPMSEMIEESIKEKLSALDLPEKYLQSFFTIDKPTPLIKQKQEIVAIKEKLLQEKLFNKIKNLSANDTLGFLEKYDNNIFKKIVNHIQKYKWFGMMHMWGSPFSKEKFFEQLKTTEIFKKERIREPVLPKELEWLQQQTPELSYWRNYVAEVCGIVSYLALDNLKQASQKMGLTYNLASWLSLPEFSQGLRGGPIPSRETIKKRKKAFGLIIKESRIIILTGNELQQIINSVLSDISGISEVLGMVANSGKIIGKAKIVLSPNEIDKVAKGDIMISPETTPDFVPAAHRAAALITNIGGITSHAAIISREIGIPCIVGTKVATRVFKDGDLIEVDAEHGKVKKL